MPLVWAWRSTHLARAGRVTMRGREYPKLRLRIVEPIIENEQFDTPPVPGRQQKAQQQLVFCIKEHRMEYIPRLFQYIPLALYCLTRAEISQ